MMRLPPFAYKPARSVDEAIALLAEHGADALPASGGTDLYANMKQRLFTPKVVVGLRPIKDLHFIDYDTTSGLSIGALATLTDVAESPAVRTHYACLAQAAETVSTPQLRNMGTIGGNVCVDTRCNYYNQNLDWRKALGYCMKRDGDICRVAPSSPKCVAVNSSDTAPALIALAATLHLAGPAGTRQVAIADFYRDDGMFAWAKQPGEIVTKITLPPPRPHTRSAYVKLRLRNSFDFPIVGVAAMLRVDDDGICRDARVVVNAVSPRPIEVARAASALVGTRLEAAALEAAAGEAFNVARPLDNTSASIPYRKRMVRVYARRALESACRPAIA
jgi:4-hydroxybenzoyl-CoA reductase subunit beta